MPGIQAPSVQAMTNLKAKAQPSVQREAALTELRTDVRREERWEFWTRGVVGHGKVWSTRYGKVCDRSVGAPGSRYMAWSVSPFMSICTMPGTTDTGTCLVVSTFLYVALPRLASPRLA